MWARSITPFKTICASPLPAPTRPHSPPEEQLSQLEANWASTPPSPQLQLPQPRRAWISVTTLLPPLQGLQRTQGFGASHSSGLS